MSLRVVGPTRILIAPDTAPTQTAGGLYIPDTYNDGPPMSGRVIQVGGDSAFRIQQRTIRECISIVEQVSEMFQHPAGLQVAVDELGRFLLAQKPVTLDVQVGDRVVFSPAKAVEMVIGEDERYVVLEEEDVLAVYEAEESAA